jgi:hypothetical protein
VSLRHCVLPFSFDRSGDTLLVAIADPELAGPALDMLRQAWPKQVQIFIAPRHALQAMMDHPAAAQHQAAPAGGGVSFSSQGRGRGQSSFTGMGRGVSRSDLDMHSYDTGSTSHGWGTASPAAESAPQLSTQALDALRASLEARLLVVQQLEQRMQHVEARVTAPLLHPQLEQRLQQVEARQASPQLHPQLDQHLQRLEQRLQQAEAKQASGGGAQPLEQRLQQLERAVQAQLSQLQADQQALRLQMQRLEHTLEAEVELLRQLHALLLSSPQTDRKAYLERVAPLR